MDVGGVRAVRQGREPRRGPQLRKVDVSPIASLDLREADVGGRALAMLPRVKEPSSSGDHVFELARGVSFVN